MADGSDPTKALSDNTSSLRSEASSSPSPPEAIRIDKATHTAQRAHG
jgi:hypothetical protein